MDTPLMKPKKSVALSGVPAGNTALCSVGNSGNDLHYRGYDIHDLANNCEFEEIAYLLIYGELPTREDLNVYKKKLVSLRGLSAEIKSVLKTIPGSAHPMDVLRTYTSVLGAITPEVFPYDVDQARNIADRLLASYGSALLYWYHYSHNNREITEQTNYESIGEHFLYLLHGSMPDPHWIKAMHISLILYAEHEFNASTFTSRGDA